MQLDIPGYDLLLPGRIVFGWGRSAELGHWAAGIGRRAFLITATRWAAGEAAAAVQESLRAAGVEPIFLATTEHHEPECRHVDAALDRLCARLRSDATSAPQRGDLVIGIGGGAALDLAKAIAALAPQSQQAPVVDYLESVGRGLQLTAPPLPWIAVPTTGGTGSEATKNAVISSREPPFKKSLRDDRLLASVALVDPKLSTSLPPAATAHSGLDAITQLIESYLTPRARPFTQALIRDALPRAVEALPLAVADGQHRPAREALSHAALISGIALANSGLGIAHAVAAALGAVADVRHGLACAVMLPHALSFNRPVCLKALAELGRLIEGPSPATTHDAADTLESRVDSLLAGLQIPRRLRDLGIRREQLPQLVPLAQGNSLSGNPRPVDPVELAAFLESCW